MNDLDQSAQASAHDSVRPQPQWISAPTASDLAHMGSLIQEPMSRSPRSGDMPAQTPVAESRIVLNEIAGHVFAGLICFLTLTLLGLCVNHEGGLDVLRERPDFAAILWLGALISFAPVIICVAVGSVRRGEQRFLWADSEDAPR